MAKRLIIDGIEKPFIIDGCSSCPFNNDNCNCGLAHLFCINNMVDFENKANLHSMYDHTPHPYCPLPDATEATADVWPDDENHRLGPNGERLIAVESVPTSGNSILQFCAVCFCFKHSLPCFPCEKEQREDGRNIHWELAGDRT